MERMSNVIFQTLAGSVFSDRKAFTERYRDFFADEPDADVPHGDFEPADTASTGSMPAER
jgi:hypothetical protein